MNEDPHHISTLLNQAVESASPPGDFLRSIERRAFRKLWMRRFASFTSTLVAVLALIVVVPSFRNYVPGLSSEPAAGGRPAGNPSPAPITLNQPPAKAVRWFYRGYLPVGSQSGIDVRAAQAWAGRHALRANEVSIVPLLGVQLPDRTRILVAQMYQVATTEVNTIIYAEPPGESGRLERDDPSPVSMREISWTVTASGIRYVIIVGSQTDSSVEFSPDGRSFRQVKTLSGYQGGPGWAVFPQPASSTTTALIKLDGIDAMPLYQGPLDNR